MKDVVFGGDAAPFSNSNAATNWSIIRNIAINTARMVAMILWPRRNDFLLMISTSFFIFRINYPCLAVVESRDRLDLSSGNFTTFTETQNSPNPSQQEIWSDPPQI